MPLAPACSRRSASASVIETPQTVTAGAASASFRSWIQSSTTRMPNPLSTITISGGRAVTKLRGRFQSIQRRQELQVSGCGQQGSQSFGRYRLSVAHDDSFLRVVFAHFGLLPADTPFSCGPRV